MINGQTNAFFRDRGFFPAGQLTLVKRATALENQPVADAG
jgi:hypothetical protein